MLQPRHHGTGAATAAQHHGLRTLPLLCLHLQWRQKTLHISVVAMPASFFEGCERVHGTQSFGEGAQLSAETHHLLLVRNRHAQAAAPHGLQSIEHRLQIFSVTGKCQVAPIERHGL